MNILIKRGKRIVIVYVHIGLMIMLVMSFFRHANEFLTIGQRLTFHSNRMDRRMNQFEFSCQQQLTGKHLQRERMYSNKSNNLTFKRNQNRTHK